MKTRCQEGQSLISSRGLPAQQNGFVAWRMQTPEWRTHSVWDVGESESDDDIHHPAVQPPVVEGQVHCVLRSLVIRVSATETRAPGVTYLSLPLPLSLSLSLSLTHTTYPCSPQWKRVRFRASWPLWLSEYLEQTHLSCFSTTGGKTPQHPVKEGPRGRGPWWNKRNESAVETTTLLILNYAERRVQPPAKAESPSFSS